MSRSELVFRQDRENSEATNRPEENARLSRPEVELALRWLKNYRTQPNFLIIPVRATA